MDFFQGLMYYIVSKVPEKQYNVSDGFLIAMGTGILTIILYVVFSVFIPTGQQSPWLLLVAFVISLLLALTIKYSVLISKRKRLQKLSTESKQVSSDGKLYCVFCKKFTDSEIDKSITFCNVCGKQRGILE